VAHIQRGPDHEDGRMGMSLPEICSDPNQVGNPTSHQTTEREPWVLAAPRRDLLIYTLFSQITDRKSGIHTTGSRLATHLP